MTTEAYAAQRLLREQLEAIAKAERCACGHELLVAHWQGGPHLRCGACGYDPETVPKNQNASLLRVYEREGAAALGPMERMILERQLRGRLRRNPEDGKARYLLERLEGEMNTGRDLVPVAQTQELLPRLTPQHIITYLCPRATQEEALVFLQVCVSYGLNPFLGDAYLIKYSEKDKAAIVIGKDAYLKDAEQNAQFDGFEAGIIIETPTGAVERRAGMAVFPKETLVGGWAKVYRKDRRLHFAMEVDLESCIKRTRDGNLTEFWAENKQALMVRKVALKRCLQEAFPTLKNLLDVSEVAELPELPAVDLVDMTPLNAEESVGRKQPEASPSSPEEDARIADFVAAFAGVSTFQELEDIASQVWDSNLSEKAKEPLRAAYNHHWDRLESGRAKEPQP